MMRRVLISGCALALLASEAQAQDSSAPAQAPQTPAATAPAPEAPAAAAPTEAAPPPPTTSEAPASPATPPPPAAATGKAAPGMRMLRGRTYDKTSGEAVPLVRVIIKGTTKGVETDLKGYFTLEIPQEAVVLDISSQDYKQRDVLVPPTQQSVNVPLEPSFTEEMVVVGRASEVARKNLANSVATVKADEVTRAPAATVDQALQGKVAGANIQSNSGAPGGGLQLRMRGVSTIYGQSAPLYVIDGVLVSDVAVASGVFAVTKSTGGSNPDPTQDNQVNRIADLNPNDIESIEILKGASAAAIYGSKASNGVVIINTKRGRAGQEPRVDVSQRFGVYSLSNKLGTRTFSKDETYAYNRNLAVALFGENGENWTGKTYDHEQQLAGRHDLSTETVASVSGASGDTRYFGSAQIKNDEGIIANTGYEKQSFRLNLGQKFGELVDVNASANVVHSLGQRGITNNDNTGITYYMALTPTPSFLNLEPDTKGVFPKNVYASNGSNPLQTAALMKNDEDVWRVIASTDLTVNAYKDADSELRFLGNFGLDRFQQENTLFFPPELYFESSADGTLGTSLYGTTQSRNLNGGLNAVYTYRPQGAGLSSNTSAGMQLEERSLDSVYIVSQKLSAGQPNVDVGSNVNLRQALQLVRDRGYYVQEEFITLEERLTLIGALRGEQSSNNGDPNKLYFYPKLATAYRIPSFHPAVDEFKVRLAYGETGNQPLYGQKFTELSAKNNIDGNSGLISTAVAGDKNIRPERQREVELGLDATFFDGDLLTEFTVYQRSISDLLLRSVPAPSTGYGTHYINGGALRNRGVELMLQVKPVSNEQFEWTSNTTFALNRSKVTDLPVTSFLAGGFGTSLGAFRIQKGQSATQIVGNALDANGNIVEKKLGDTEPDFRVGFSNTFRYNAFSLSFLVDWQQGSDIINLTRLLFDATANSPDWNSGGKERFDSWNRDGSIEAYIEDATFVKLREVTFSYQLPDSFVHRIPKVKSARLSVSGRNLLTFTSYSGLDPEVSNFGNQPIARNIDVGPFPPSRSFWTSIDVGF
ncbi:SusC/RagA family TonB-linked outer membrane protein [Hyalangium versicolor]|uniref:SusC/RagA family TonB-linked outer membrane protein n=1 Tax=Hyalangium versicolor TaxID=2861190 RepID=UPI001CCB87C3|nr:SusC/RagA family TonB-linked outer membrane protein [Hyalangium versicolor]